jgi:hypothetical protein
MTLEDEILSGMVYGKRDYYNINDKLLVILTTSEMFSTPSKTKDRSIAKRLLCLLHYSLQRNLQTYNIIKDRSVAPIYWCINNILKFIHYRS